MSTLKRPLSSEMQAAVNQGYISEKDAHRDQIVVQPQRTDEVVWRGLLRKNGNGAYYGDEANVLHALRSAPELQSAIRYNEFFNRVEVGSDVFWRNEAEGTQWTDDDDLDVMAWLQKNDIPVRSKSAVGDAIERVAKDNIYHPVRQYLDGLEWDGGSRLHTWLHRYLGAESDSEYLRAVGTAFLVSAVARIYEPGCQADHMLVFSGSQGIGKTRATQILGWPWTTDSVPDLHSKDSAIHLQGVWLVEMAELAALRKSEIESTKAFISRRVDRYRPPYGKRTVEIPRQCVFVGTTNETEYLKDPTGNRRFWPVPIVDVDFNALEKDRDKLLAEAVELYEQGAQWYLTGDDARQAERQQDAYRSRTENEQKIAEYLWRIEDNGETEVTTKDIYVKALNVDYDNEHERVTKLGWDVARALQGCGWHKVGSVGRYPNRRKIYRLATHTDSHR